VIRTLVPRPSWLSMSMLPWCCSTMLLTIESPRPVPFPRRLVEKNGVEFLIRAIGLLKDKIRIRLYITGDGDLRAGSGSTSVLWSVLAGLAAAWLLLLAQRAYSQDELVKIGLKGAGGLMPLALILLLAIALGDVAEALGTGEYVAQVTVDELAQV